MFTFLCVQAEDVIKNLAAEEMPRHRNSEAIYSIQDHAVLHCACRAAQHHSLNHLKALLLGRQRVYG